MKNTKPEGEQSKSAVTRPHKVRLPGFISEEIGLGDVVKRATSAFGIKTCGGCARRADALNRWLVFSGSRRK